MVVKPIVSYILFFILALTLCSSPPVIEPMKQIVSQTPEVISKDNKSSPSFKRLEGTNAYIELTNSKATTKFYDDYKTIEHEIILTPKNLADNSCFPGWIIEYDSNLITIEENSCQIKTNGELTNKECSITPTHDNVNKKLTIEYKFKLYNTDQAIIKWILKYTKSDREILYKADGIVIPLIKGSKFCDYTFIIPDAYTNLGLANNLLTKQSDTSDTIYIYHDECPTDSEGLNDIIRYTPKQSLWKATMGIYLEYSPNFTNKIGFKFPRYYIGGKLKNTYHRIFSTENDEYEENNIINENKQFQVEVPAENKNKVGALLYTAFTNKLSDNFEVDLPEDFYKIDKQQIDPDIKSKAEEIISEASDLPNYYKIGKFVKSYINYDISYVGKTLTIKEIYERKTGVCEHYTLLYNAMLNAINIPTLYISGWAFDKSQTSGNKDTLTHAWTAAFIDGKWKELDATWGLFEGVPAGHIFKNFNKDTFSYFYYETLDSNRISFYQDPVIQMVTDENDLKDPFITPEIEGDDDDKKSEVINEDNHGNNGDNNHGNNGDNNHGNNGDNNQGNNGDNNHGNNEDNDGDLNDKSSFAKSSIILLILSCLDFIL